MVLSGIMESGRESGHRDIDANDPSATCRDVRLRAAVDGTAELIRQRRACMSSSRAVGEDHPEEKEAAN